MAHCPADASTPLLSAFWRAGAAPLLLAALGYVLPYLDFPVLLSDAGL